MCWSFSSTISMFSVWFSSKLNTCGLLHRYKMMHVVFTKHRNIFSITQQRTFHKGKPLMEMWKMSAVRLRSSTVHRNIATVCVSVWRQPPSSQGTLRWTRPQSVRWSTPRSRRSGTRRSSTTSTNALRRWIEMPRTTNQVVRVSTAARGVSVFALPPLWMLNSLRCFVGVAGLHCSRNWDGWLCWEDTPAGTYTSQNCPNYFPDFDPTGEQWDATVWLLF